MIALIGAVAYAAVGAATFASAWKRTVWPFARAYLTRTRPLEGFATATLTLAAVAVPLTALTVAAGIGWPLYLPLTAYNERQARRERDV